jgi:hypothetical protein
MAITGPNQPVSYQHFEILVSTLSVEAIQGASSHSAARSTIADRPVATFDHANSSLAFRITYVHFAYAHPEFENESVRAATRLFSRNRCGAKLFAGVAAFDLTHVGAAQSSSCADVSEVACTRFG